jgi:hypothetical protein
MKNRNSRQLSFLATATEAKPIKQKIGVYAKWSKQIEELGYGKITKPPLLSEISVINSFIDAFKAISA